MKIPRPSTHAGYAVALLCLIAGVFFLITGGNVGATIILVVLEAAFWALMQYFKNRRHQHQ
jgi:hypothetical protein